MRIISGEFGGRLIKTIAGNQYRPATQKVRQALFSILEARGADWPDMRVIDFFAGSGSIGLEALSRGAKEVWFVEKNKKAVNFLRQNLINFKIHTERYRVIHQDAFILLKNPPAEPFQLLFIDPPYGRGILAPFLEKLNNQTWLDHHSWIAAEVESTIELVPHNFSGLSLEINRTYGQTRILLWTAEDRR